MRRVRGAGGSRLRVQGARHGVALTALARLASAMLGLGWASSGGVAQTATGCPSPGATPLRPEPSFFLPGELGDGASWAGGVRASYAASLRLHPTLGIGSGRRLRLSASGAVAYFSPEIAFMGGGRVSYRIAHPVDLLGSGLFVHVAGEGLWGTRDRRTMAGALILDADRFAQLTVRVGRELRDHDTFFEISLGTDVALWAGHPATRPPSRRPEPFARFTGFFRIVAVRMSTEASWLCDSTAAALAQARAAVSDATRQPDVQSLATLLRGRGLDRLAGNVEATIREAQSEARHENVPVPEFQDPGTQRRLVEALVHGWRVAMGESPGG